MTLNPNQRLSRIRGIVSKYSGPGSLDKLAIGELINHIKRLDEELMKGGVLPWDWAPPGIEDDMGDRSW